MLLRNPAHKKNNYIPAAELEEISSTPLDIVQASQNSQDSEITVTLSSPSQKLLDDFELTDNEEPEVKTYEEKEVQTEEAVFITKEEFEQLQQKASTCAEFKKDLEKLSAYFSSTINKCPEMSPSEFEKICRQVGADNLLKAMYDLMSSERMSDERKSLTKLRAMVVIYIMIYSHSQRANWFQVTLARTLQQFGIMTKVWPL